MVELLIVLGSGVAIVSIALFILTCGVLIAAFFKGDS
jgi:hypothetical protein